MNDAPLLPELLSQLWFRFLLVTLFGFLTGLEIREYLLSLRRDQTTTTPHISPGSARTYTFIAILGFVLYELDPNLRLYLAGFTGLLLFFGLFYYHKLQEQQRGILQPLIGLIVYSYGPCLSLQPIWFLVLLFVTTVFVLNARPLTHRLTETIDRQELVTLAKFLLLAAVVLPLMPDRQVFPLLPTTPFKIWVGVVTLSAISYLGYILQRYLLPGKSDLITGLLGGLYSSTATTVVLARRSRGGDPATAKTLGLAIVAASGMMYLRLLILIAILNRDFLHATTAPFLLLGGGAILFTLLAKKRLTTGPPSTEAGNRNPLELGTAFLFAGLFVVMLLATKFVLHRFGAPGLQALSFAVGFTDIDPFVLSLLKGEYRAAGLQELAAAVVIAAGSNNFLKALYAILIGGWCQQRSTALVLCILGVLTLGYGVWLAV